MRIPDTTHEDIRILIMRSAALQDRAYEIIKERIISCEYVPGSFLNTVALQAQLGFSRTPIREAVGRLEQENLVRVIPKKGFLVCELDINTIKAIYETRMVLEPYIVNAYGDKLDKEELQASRRRFTWRDITPETKEHFYRYDDEFHAFIRAACPNIYLAQSLDRIADQNRRVRVLSGNVVRRLEQSCNEHISIIDALLANDLRKAGEAMVAHLEHSRRTAFSLLLALESPPVIPIHALEAQKRTAGSR